MTKNLDIKDTALYFCYTLGGCLFLFGKCGILNMLISFVAGIISFFLLSLFCKTKFSENKAFKLLMVSLCAFVVAYTFMEFAKFTTARILITTPRFAIVILFAGIISVFSAAKEKAVYKFCLLFMIVGSILCMVVILASLANFEATNLDCLPGFEFKEIARNYLIIFLPCFIPGIKASHSVKSGVLGISLAAAIIIIFSLLTVCTFGRLNDILDYPILSLADTINSGRIFTRLGSFFHAVIYVTGLIRCVISIIKIKYIFNFAR